MIVTPYAIAVLVLLAAFASGSGQAMTQLIALTAVVLLLDLIAMLSAQRILNTPYVALILGIVGAVIGVLQIALGVQAMADGLRLLRGPSA
jgi:small neutral amino acid transporter SnatA (MarC family)